MDKYSLRRIERHLSMQLEWGRLVAGNQKLKLDLRWLRAKYGFPVKGPKEFNDWTQVTSHKTIRQYHREMALIAKKHHIDLKKWGSNFEQLVTLGEVMFHFPKTNHYPAIRMTRKTGGEWVYDLIIGSEADLEDPDFQIVLAEMQKALRDLKDMPPHPTKHTTSRRLDWRPVWEWHKQHPNVTKTELADILGYNRSYFSRKLNELE